MNSIWLILLLLCCCNGGCDGNGREQNNCGGCACSGAREGGCSSGRNSGRDACNNPFSPLNRRDRDDNDYPAFRGNNGPCGCEENQD